MSHPPTTEQSLQQLLYQFDAKTLGEGNLTIGTNLLGAMAISLSNLAKPRSGILGPDNNVTPVGCSLLINGSLNSSMVLDEVVTPAGICQDNLISNLTRLLKDNQAEQMRAGSTARRRWQLTKQPAQSPGEESLFSLMTAEPGMEDLFRSRQALWQDTLTSAPSDRLENLIRRPRAFIAASTASLLEAQLKEAHMGKPYAVIGLCRPASVTLLGDVCPPLLDGILPAGPNGELVRGRLLVTDSAGVLQQVANATNEKTDWLGRVLWLVEGNAGPDLDVEAGDGTVRLNQVQERFRQSLVKVFANRLENHGEPPITIQFDLSKHQARWMRFLAEMETSLPGISGPARHLLASLVFGLNRLVEACDRPNGFVYSIQGINALARHLVRRMANARAVMINGSRRSLQEELKKKALMRLGQEPMDNRGLYRALRIPAAECEELLEDLQSTGAIHCNEGCWELSSTPFNSSTRDRLPLEV